MYGTPTHGEAFFLPNEENARIMVHDEDHLRHDVLKLFGQAFAITWPVNAKERDQKVVEDQRLKENMEHHRDVERLWAEINRLMIYTKKLNDSELKSTA